MPQEPASASSGRDADPAGLPDEPVPTPDWMTEADWLAWCESSALDDEPSDPEEEEPELAPEEQVGGTAGFAARRLLDGMPGAARWLSWLMPPPGATAGTRVPPIVSWTG